MCGCLRIFGDLKMIIVGIECTAHTFGVGVVNQGKVLSNVRDMYSTEEGGIIPSESAQHHRRVAGEVWGNALQEAGISEEDISAIAVSNAPGLAPCLYEGMAFARERAEELGVELVGVNHCVAHLEIGQSVGASDPVLLYASGANTQVIAFTAGYTIPRVPKSSGSQQEHSGAAGKYRVFGETLDLGVGNFIDKFARHVGLGFPGGPALEKVAVGGKYVELPYSIKGMDVSFSGLQTKLQQLYDRGIGKVGKQERKIDNSKESVGGRGDAGDMVVDDNGLNLDEKREKVLQDLAFSMQETVFAMLVEAAERALAHTGKKELVLGGGVGCNSRLQEMCRLMCSERGAKFFCPSRDLLVDNAAMIAFTGEIMLNSGVKAEGEIEVKPRERTDDVAVTWRD
jgi:N6-L-threonylcarbamoyladenine synthase